MRLLLINPWIYDFAAYDLWSKPLGLLAIAGALKKLGCSVKLIDCLDRFDTQLIKYTGRAPHCTLYGSGNYHSEVISKPPIFKNIPRRFKRYGFPKELFESILAAEKAPDAILVTTGMTYWYPAYADTVRILKKRFASTPILIGGNYVNLCYDHAKRYSGADIIYKGSSIPDILETVLRLGGERLNISSGIDWQGTPPYYELYPELRYVTLRTSSGCPFRCTYCGWYLLENGFRQKDADNVAGEIEYYYKRHNIRNFAFYDEAFLYNPEGHIVRIFETLLKRDVKANFHTPNGLHNRFMTAKVAALLKMAGFVKPRLALETSSSKVQSETGAKTTNEEFISAVINLKEAGFNGSDIGTYILIGLPGQEIEDVKASIKFAASHGVRIHLEEYSPIPNTPDYARSSLPVDADPLLHNNSAFPLYDLPRYRDFQTVKDMARRLNLANSA